jgi:hypothetical protein
MTRLVQRGHTPEALAPLLLQAATGIENAQASSNTDVSSNTLYLHWTYNPNGIQSNTIRYLYNKILQPYAPFDRMQIALSRPKNLRDLLTRTQLEVPENINIPELIDNLKQNKENKTKHNHELTRTRQP